MAKPAVVSKQGHRRPCETRLIDVQLPRMNVESSGDTSTLTIHERQPCEGGWKNAKIRAPSSRKPGSEHTERSRWNFEQSTSSQHKPVGVRVRLRIPVTIRTPDGK